MNIAQFLQLINVELERKLLESGISSIKNRTAYHESFHGTPTQEVLEYEPGVKCYWGMESDEDIVFHLSKEDMIKHVIYTKKSDTITQKVLDLCNEKNISTSEYSGILSL